MATLNASVDLPPTPLAPRAARRAVRELLALWHAPQSVVDAELLVTELVTNAVEHAGGEASLGLRISLSGGRLRVALSDGSSERPVLRQLRGLELRGRGVHMIATLASRWGCHDHHGGKIVWFEIDPPPRGAGIRPARAS